MKRLFWSQKAGNKLQLNKQGSVPALQQLLVTPIKLLEMSERKKMQLMNILKNLGKGRFLSK
jgi:hypothetical protein